MEFFCRVFLLAVLLSCSGMIVAQSCALNCPDNVVVRADSGKGGTAVSFSLPVISGNCGAVSFVPASGSFFRLGSSSVIVSAASGARCSFTVTVTDNEAPVLSDLKISPKRIWPANNKMKEVAVHYSCSDNSGEDSCTLTVTSNDPAGVKSWEIVNPHLVRLMASRLPGGEARIYTLTVTGTDASGNATKRTTSIGVARNIVARENDK